MRRCGILLPVSSLPSPYGIGAFSKEAFDFVDQLKSAGQQCWQILPLGPTGAGDSPYQSVSSFAGNPYFIDLETLTKEGLLTEAECEEVDFGEDETLVDYGLLYQNRPVILRKAFERWKEQADAVGIDPCTLTAFLPEGTRDYCLYAAVKHHFHDIPWYDWEEDIRVRKPEALARYRELLADDILYYEFLQLQFDRQWKKLKTYANEQGIQIIGDMPIYVALDSADTWCHPELFQVDEKGQPTAVSGCPPDAFSETGQLWGNPLYNWDYQKETGYAWWQNRLAYGFAMYDVVRIDHFRGFAGYYSIPAGDATAENGEWKQGPGYDFFEKMKEAFGELPIIAEDLGMLTPDVPELLEKCGFPGMKVLEFAFSASEKSTYLPMFYEKNCVVYTGTHDNEPLAGWLKTLPEKDEEFLRAYLGAEELPVEELPWAIIRLALASVADLVIIPMADYLGLGSEARINTPATVGINWRWRMKKDDFSEKLCGRCEKLSSLYAREQPEPA